MLTITRVLCPVDLSAAAADALRYATQFSSIVHAELSVLWVGSDAPDSRDERDSRELATFVAETVESTVETHLSIATVSRPTRYFVHPRRLEPI